MGEAINTHHMVCDFGKYKGTLYTRVPVGYLRWMVNNKVREYEIAAAELKRRGAVLPDIEVSGHAIDRASQQLIGAWTRTRHLDEGLHAWLVRMAVDALREGKKKGDKYHYNGMKFAFEQDTEWPVLKTVMRDGREPT